MTTVFTTERYAYMSTRLHTQLYERGVSTGSGNCTIVRDRFADGELHLKVEGPLWGQETVLVGGFPTDADFMELVDTATLLAERGARSLRIFIPYFGYSTQERATEAGECRTAKTRARLLSSIPARGGCTVYLMDAHTEGLIGYFEGATMAHHLYCESALLPAMREIGGASFMLGTTDGGRVKWIQSYAEKLGCEMAIITKRRYPDGKTKVVGFCGDVQGQRVLLFDDMIRTGGTTIGAAEENLRRGAKSVIAVATHAVLPGSSLDRIKASGAIERVVLTNTTPRALELQREHPDFVTVIPIEGLIASAIANPDAIV